MVQREAFTSPFILSPIPTTLGDPQHATVRHPRVPLDLRELLHAHVLIGIRCRKVVLCNSVT